MQSRRQRDSNQSPCFKVNCFCLKKDKMSTEHICSPSQPKCQSSTAVLASDLCGICTHGSCFKNRALVTTRHAKSPLPWSDFKEGRGLPLLVCCYQENFFHCAEPVANCPQLSAIKFQQQICGPFKAIPQLCFTNSTLYTFNAFRFFLGKWKKHHSKTYNLFPPLFK